MLVRGRFRVAAASRLPVSVMLALMIGASPAPAAVEQCRLIQAKADREACYQRQEIELATKRKSEPAADTRTMESLQQMRRGDDAVYQSLRSICRGC
jgi:Tfp pilus assembly protein PilN